MFQLQGREKRVDKPVKVNREINPRHAVIKRLAATRKSDADKVEFVAEQLLEDPSRMVARLNKLLESV